jgi:hypothetical protein
VPTAAQSAEERVATAVQTSDWMNEWWWVIGGELIEGIIFLDLFLNLTTSDSLFVCCTE